MGDFRVPWTVGTVVDGKMATFPGTKFVRTSPTGVYGGYQLWNKRVLPCTWYLHLLVIALGKDVFQIISDGQNVNLPRHHLLALHSGLRDRSNSFGTGRCHIFHSN